MECRNRQQYKKRSCCFHTNYILINKRSAKKTNKQKPKTKQNENNEKYIKSTETIVDITFIVFFVSMHYIHT